VALWSYDHHRWSEASSDPFAWDPADHTVSGTIPASSLFFAAMLDPAAAIALPTQVPEPTGTVVPEPTALGLIAAAGALAVRRRRRHSSDV
jgi:hypothetical protein